MGLLNDALVVTPIVERIRSAIGVRKPTIGTQRVSVTTQRATSWLTWVTLACPRMAA